MVKKIVKELKQLHKLAVLVDNEEEFEKASVLFGIVSENKNVQYNG